MIQESGCPIIGVRPGAGQQAYRGFLLTLLMVILTFNQMDGTALGILLQDIKSDLHLSDTKLGVLSGISFAAFYSLMGIPIARWADRGNRATVITVTTGLWSIAVALCGAAHTFMALMLTRTLVAAGESGCVPSAHSLIADYFEREERARAVARYMLGIPLALAIGYFAAGWLNAFFGWRITFVFFGAPGFALAVIARFTIREPRLDPDTGMVRPNPRSSGDAEKSEAALSFQQTIKVLWHVRSFRHMLFCHSVWYFFGYGLLQWAPTFFIRSHGLSSAEIGTWFAISYGLGGLGGVYIGGELATRYAAGNERLQLKACAIAFSLFAGLNAFAYLVRDYRLAFVGMALAAIGGNVVQGPILATMQTLVPTHMRATSVAVTYLFANLIGMGLGPLAAGALSDALHPVFGQNSLRYALLILCPGYLWAAWHLLRAARTIAEDLPHGAIDGFSRMVSSPATPSTVVEFSDDTA